MRKPTRRFNVSPLRKVTIASPSKVAAILRELGYVEREKGFVKGNIHFMIPPVKETESIKGGTRILVHKDRTFVEGGESMHHMAIDNDVQDALRELIRRIRKR